MSGSATYTLRIVGGSPVWVGPRSVTAIFATDETEGTRALVKGERWTVVAGLWHRAGLDAGLSSLEAASYPADSVLQVTAAPGVVAVPPEPLKPSRRVTRTESEVSE